MQETEHRRVAASLREQRHATAQPAPETRARERGGIDLLIIAANARSLIANRGDLIREIRARGHTVAAAVPRKDYLPEVEELGIPIYPFDLGRTGINPIADLRTAIALARLIRRLNPEAVFSYTVKPVVYGSLAAHWAGVPRVYAMITGLGHAFTTESWRTRVLRAISSRLYRAALARCDRVFFQNPDDLQDFLDRRILPDADRVVRINGSGVDVQRFARQPLPEGEALFLFVGRLLTEKGIVEFVDAARQVHAQYPNARFVVVGPHNPDLPHSIPAEQVEAWKREGIVEFAGGVADVRPWLELASVFVLPSYREGTPRSVLEAMSVGRPIVTTDAPGCRETVLDGENGFLVPPRTSAPLAEAMQRFLDDPSLLARMARASRERVEAKYEVGQVNRVILRSMELS
ncbi:glycosyltransferase family 4 protein [Thioalkalivibrio sp. ALE30]|uniref:glycosyltransferase family 4 protein n=1 Tax=Thioalkalivibrio sp. ALE30 TaxID=1158181 RepID=UPI00035C3B52|nr:glycosyltransferase family 4 protein [Thioalkalivibrio sp. ALE30]